MKKTISGIRGIIGDDLRLADVMQFCDNFSDMVNGKCVTGMDTRPTSDMISHMVHATLMKNGIDVYDLSMAPTPVLFYEARKMGAGIMITSSHNPLDWNGLKFVLHGRGINESELPQITHGKQHKKRNYDNIKPGTQTSHHSSYIKQASKIIGSVNETPTVIVDVGGGAALNVASQLYTKIGCNVKTINHTLYSRGPDPTTDNLQHLVDSKASIGFAFDLDGDRLVIVLDGVKQTPDVTLGLGVMGALERGCKKFVLSVDTSLGVENLITMYGGVCVRAKVGEANVVDEMIKRQAQVGGEGSSGGFIFSEFNHCRDGILAGGMIMTGFSNAQNHLQDVLSTLNKYTILRTKVTAQSAQHEYMMNRASQWLKAKSSEIIELDGIKGILDDENWILIRPSNTEDAIRVSVESSNAEKCRILVDKLTSVMRD